MKHPVEDHDPPPSKTAKTVTVYTDGACSGNPGPGGYAAVLLYGTGRKEISGGFRWTTNNRMELMALVEAFRALKQPCELSIHTDSKYLLGGLSKGWLKGWKKKGWKTASGSQVQNRDLWETLDSLLSKHKATFLWVKGHSTSRENNRCDELAVKAVKNHRSAIDHPYEHLNPFPSKAPGKN
jgi:ribonuclease HI